MKKRYNMSKDVYKKQFRELSVFSDEFPHMRCSCCTRGAVDRPERISNIETGESKRSKGHDAWEPDWVRGIWSGVGMCTNKECRQPYAFSGETVYTFDHRGYEVFPEYHIKTIYPNIVLFDIPKIYPQKAKDSLLNSFTLLFSNPSSSANALRLSLESFFDELNIRKSKIIRNKRHRLSLHERIKEYLPVSKYASFSSYAEAIKWIGNAGSHTSYLTVEDILQGYEFLKVILVDFDLKDKKARLAGAAKEVNRKKRPTSK